MVLHMPLPSTALQRQNLFIYLQSMACHSDQPGHLDSGVAVRSIRLIPCSSQLVRYTAAALMSP